MLRAEPYIYLWNERDTRAHRDITRNIRGTSVERQMQLRGRNSSIHPSKTNITIHLCDQVQRQMVIPSMENLHGILRSDLEPISIVRSARDVVFFQFNMIPDYCSTERD